MRGLRTPWLMGFLAVGAVLLAAGSYWFWQQGRTVREAGVAAPTVAPSPPPPVPSPKPVPPVAAKPAPAPSFDIVRVAPDGTAVIAGRAQPGAEVVVKDGAAELGRVVADARGEWALVPSAPLAPGTRELTLTARLKSGESVDSDRSVVLAVPAPGRDLSGAPSLSAATGGALAVVTAREGPAAKPTASTVLQRPESTSAPSGPLALDVIDYDEAGAVVITGHAPPGTEVRLYLDGRAIGGATAGAASGVWQLSPDQEVPKGVYTLRVDQLGADGKVKARVESPFAQAIVPGAGRSKNEVVVQPGNSLWRIAHSRYGEGTRYTVIYQANREQIRDPDLIYPGQVFALPPTE